MANWYGRASYKTGTGWIAGDQTQVAGPSVSIAGSIPGVTGAMDVNTLAPTTLTASANIHDSTNVAVPDGLTVVVMKQVNGVWTKVTEILTSGGTGLAQYTNTQLPPHPDYIFVIPRQTNWPNETICTPLITPV